MAATIPALPALVTPGDLGDEMGAFVRHLRAENLSPNSVYAYVGAVVSLGNYLIEHRLPTDVAAIKREHIQDWQIDLLGRYKPATAHQRYRGAQRFFAWCESVMDDPAHPFVSPMRRMKPPKLDDYLPIVLTLDELRALVAACDGRTFEDRRDAALIRIFFDTGARRAEIANLRWSRDADERDVDFTRGQVRLFGKGRRERFTAISPRTVEALEKYERLRRLHPHAEEPWLWLGRKGRLTDSGIAQTVRDIGMRAGIPGLHPHVLRHSWRHHADVAGTSREDLMALGGWRSDAMLRRYASGEANNRALDRARERAIGDQI